MTPAPYFRRVLALFVDALFVGIPTGFLVGVGAGLLFTDDGNTIGVLPLILGIIWPFAAWVWNKIVREGRTGQSLGKSVMRIVLVSAEDGSPIGPGKAFIREILAGVLGSVTAGLFTLVDLLFPLFDSRNQRVVDKMLDTRVVSRA